jgi:hypothetical protein
MSGTTTPAQSVPTETRMATSAPSVPADRSCGTRTAASVAPALAALAYGVMLLCVWARFATTTGMGWETAFTIASEDSRSWRNFLYMPDPLRIHNAQFFELAYRVGELLGIRGSFFPYELVYAGLWWSRSVLVFLLLRRLAPGSTILPFTAGAILMVHAPDVLLGWVGQMHQFGYFVWLLISLHLLLSCFQPIGAGRLALYVGLNGLVAYLCLWTYEGPLFIMAAAPVVLAFLVRPTISRRLLVVCAAWYLPIVVYLYRTAQKYLVLSGGGYQQSLIRESLAPGDILGDWVFNVLYSLSFWAWVPRSGDLQPFQIAAMALAVTVVFLAAGLAISRWSDPVWVSPMRVRQLWSLLAAGAVFLVLSFPAHLLLAAAREPRRTQLLSGIAASIVLGALCSLLAAALPRPRFRQLCAVTLAVPIVFVGAVRTIERQASHRAEWNHHLPIMQRLLRSVPRVRDGTVVVMTDVPRSPDPFYASHFWFNNALRLAYPRTVVAGVYYYEDGTPGPDMNLRLQGRQWLYTNEAIPPMITSADITQTIVLRDDRSGMQVLSEIPALVCADGCVAHPYDPLARIEAGPPAIEARRRYGGW